MYNTNIDEGEEYVNAIIDDLKWLGYTPDLVCFGSDYFEKTYEKATNFIISCLRRKRRRTRIRVGTVF